MVLLDEEADTNILVLELRKVKHCELEVNSLLPLCIAYPLLPSCPMLIFVLLQGRMLWEGSFSLLLNVHHDLAIGQSC